MLKDKDVSKMQHLFYRLSPRHKNAIINAAEVLTTQQKTETIVENIGSVAGDEKEDGTNVL